MLKFENVIADGIVVDVQGCPKPFVDQEPDLTPFI